MTEPTIKLELTAALFGNLRALVVAGAKSPTTGEDAVMAGAQLLAIMAQAAADANAPKSNGHAQVALPLEQPAPAAV